jgi:hypothetical protein
MRAVKTPTQQAGLGARSRRIGGKAKLLSIRSVPNRSSFPNSLVTLPHNSCRIVSREGETAFDSESSLWQLPAATCTRYEIMEKASPNFWQ